MPGWGQSCNIEAACEFIASIIECASKCAQGRKAGLICITIADYEIKKLNFISEVMKRLQFNSEQWSVISHEESFAFYAYSQKKVCIQQVLCFLTTVMIILHHISA